MGILALQSGNCCFGGGPGKLVAQTGLPHPLLQPSPQKGLVLAPGQAIFAGDNRAHGQRVGRGCPRSPRGSLGMQQAEINPNEPVFPGDMSQLPCDHPLRSQLH